MRSYTRSDWIVTPYGLSSAFHPTRRGVANPGPPPAAGPLPIDIPPASTSMLPPRAANARNRASCAGVSESGVPRATIARMLSAMGVESDSVTGRTT